MKAIRRALERISGAIFAAIINLLDFVMHPLQDRVGVKGMAYIFVLPNLIILAFSFFFRCF